LGSPIANSFTGDGHIVANLSNRYADYNY